MERDGTPTGADVLLGMVAMFAVIAAVVVCLLK